MWFIINTEGVNDWSEEVFLKVDTENENCPFGGAECKTENSDSDPGGVIKQYCP